MSGHRPGASRVRWLVPAVAALAVACGVLTALAHPWLCDDAFISFRYAEHLVQGLGLVFNPGERVEGYSNFLWTIWIALGMRLGVSPERWSIAWSVACYGGTIALLAARSWRARSPGEGGAPAWPLAALLAAFHPDWNAFATGGLETSLFTFLLVLGFLLLTRPALTPAATLAAGAVLGLVAMCRPDGLLFVALSGLFLLLLRRPGARVVIAFAAAFAVLWVPYTAWRLRYYGDFFSNPYYAKSAALGWYAQGLAYAWLYVQKYWVVALGLPLAGVALLGGGRATGDRGVRRRAAPAPSAPGPSHERHEAALAAAFVLAYGAWVVRVGGDFMYARFLIPVTPFLLVLLEIGLQRLGVRTPAQGAAATALAAAAMLLTPHPLSTAEAMKHGIVNERLQYPPELEAQRRREGALLATRYFHDAPVRMLFLGGGARLVYYAKPHTAIEAETGLTDRFIARLPLDRRSRVGHEKHAPLEYLVHDRGVHLTFHSSAPQTLGSAGRLPRVVINFDGMEAFLFRWDPPLIAEWVRRGARVGNFPALIDTAIAGLDRMPVEQVGHLYGMMRRFYFDHVSDPAREAPFLARLPRAAVPRDSWAAVPGEPGHAR